MQVFYAACQGLLYVLCYRLEQLAGSGSNAEALKLLFKDTMPILLQSRHVPFPISSGELLCALYSQLADVTAMTPSTHTPPPPVMIALGKITAAECIVLHFLHICILLGFKGILLRVSHYSLSTEAGPSCAMITLRE